MGLRSHYLMKLQTDAVEQVGYLSPLWLLHFKTLMGGQTRTEVLVLRDATL